MVRLYTGKQFSLSISNLDLFLIAEQDVFGTVVHKMNGIDGLVVRRSDGKEFSVKANVV